MVSKKWEHLDNHQEASIKQESYNTIKKIDRTSTRACDQRLNALSPTDHADTTRPSKGWNAVHLCDKLPMQSLKDKWTPKLSKAQDKKLKSPKARWIPGYAFATKNRNHCWKNTNTEISSKK